MKKNSASVSGYMIDLPTLPPTSTRVLLALQLPDPAPRQAIDSPLQALARRIRWSRHG
jgi:hypothetical protein